jgi:hypothetical protein
MDTNECAFLIEKGKLYNCMTILIIEYMASDVALTVCTKVIASTGINR